MAGGWGPQSFAPGWLRQEAAWDLAAWHFGRCAHCSPEGCTEGCTEAYGDSACPQGRARGVWFQCGLSSGSSGAPQGLAALRLFAQLQ